MPDDAHDAPAAQAAPADRPAASDLPALVADLLAGSLNLDRTLERLVGLLVPGYASWAQVTIEGVLGRQQVVCRASDGRVEHLSEPVPHADTHASIAGVLATGRRARIAKVDDATLRGLVPEDRREGCAPLLGRPGAVLPLMGRGAVFGTVTLLGAEGLEGDAALAALDDVAARAALFVDAARLYAERTRIADVLQRGLRPPAPPTIPGVRVAAFYRAADDASGVGGDFYDVHERGQDWTIVLGDVAGKGVEAAVLTGAVRRSIRTATLIDTTPSRVLQLLNTVLLEDPSERFVTLLCARLSEGADGAWQLDVASAGHPPPLILCADGEVATLGARGTVVGAVRDAQWEEISVTLQPGDACLLFTDGVTESRAEDGTLFGRDRIASLLAEAVGGEPEALVEHIARSAIEYGKRARDDIALLALRIDP